jgi:hypothetical protein
MMNEEVNSHFPITPLLKIMLSRKREVAGERS